MNGLKRLNQYIRCLFLIMFVVGGSSVILTCKIESPYLDTIQQRINEDLGITNGEDDNIAPTVEVSSLVGTVTATAPIPFTVAFSESVTGFEQDDINVTVGSGAVSITDFASNTAGDEYTVKVSPTNDPVTVTMTIPEAAATDEAGNPNAESAEAYSVLYDTTVLTVDSITPNVSMPTNQSPIQLTIKFSEEVSDFTPTDIVLENGWFVDDFDESDNPTFIATIKAGNQGAVTVDIPEGVATAVVTGRGNQAAEQYQFNYDITSPGIPTVSGSSPTLDTTPEWTWSSGGEGNGTFRYKLDDNDFTSGAIETTSTSYIKDLPALPEGDHTLYVQERDDAGNWSDCGSQTVTIEITPPDNPIPADGGNGLGTMPVLDWNDITDAAGYHLQINTAVGFDGTMVDESSDISTSEYEVTTILTEGETYYWRVRTENDDGVEGASWSGTWSFTVVYAVGYAGPSGGLLFYDKGSYSDGWRYLEAWTDNESGLYQWKTSETASGTSTAVGTGYDNTYTDLSGSEHPAAEVCRDATHSGNNDWFLPSKDELELVFQELVENGLGGFSDNYYWTSSEFDAVYAYTQGGPNNIQIPVNKPNVASVRAIRGF